MGCKIGGNSGLMPIVIVIVIMSHFMSLFFLKSGTLLLGCFGIIKWTVGAHDASTLPSLCLRSAFALASLLRLEARRIQNGMKQASSSPIRLSDESSLFKLRIVNLELKNIQVWRKLKIT